MTTPFFTPLTDVPYWRTTIGEEERALVVETMADNRFSQGPVSALLEAELREALDAPYALVTTSGSAALMMACLALGIGPGDEVIAPTRTFIATAHAPFLLGAKVVLVDCDADRALVQADAIEAAVTPSTRAIMVVHLNGRGCDMAAITAMARRRGLAVIEDAAQAIFSRHAGGGYMGLSGDVGIYSFGMTKLMSTGQGGAVVTRDAAIAARLLAVRDHGVRDIVTHQYLAPGFNFKFSDLLASLGLGQVRRRAEKVTHSLAVHALYREGLANHPSVRLLAADVEGGEVPLWAEALSPRRDELMSFLEARGIQTRCFLPCVHSAPHFATRAAFPNSERFAREGLILPCGPGQPLENVERTVEALTSFR